MKRLYYPVNPDKEVNNEPAEEPKSKSDPKKAEAEVGLLETRFLTLLRRVFKEANFQQLSHESMTTVLKVSFVTSMRRFSPC